MYSKLEWLESYLPGLRPARRWCLTDTFSGPGIVGSWGHSFFIRNLISEYPVFTFVVLA